MANADLQKILERRSGSISQSTSTVASPTAGNSDLNGILQRRSGAQTQAPEPELTPEEKGTTAGQSFVREATLGAIPALGGIAGGAVSGAATGAALGALGFNPITVAVGGIAGALIGGALSAFGTAEAQQSILPKIIGEDNMKRIDEKRAESAQEHPIASAAGSLAPQLITMKPSVKNLKSMTSFVKTVLSASKPEVAKYLQSPAGQVALHSTINVVTGGVAQGGGELYEQAKRGDYNAASLIANVALGSIVSEPNRFGVKLGMSPRQEVTFEPDVPKKVSVTSATPETSNIAISTPNTRQKAYANEMGYEPITPTEELPTIEMGAKPKAEAIDITKAEPPQVGSKTIEERISALSPDQQKQLLTDTRRLFGKGMDYETAKQAALGRMEKVPTGKMEMVPEPKTEPKTEPKVYKAKAGIVTSRKAPSGNIKTFTDPRSAVKTLADAGSEEAKALTERYGDAVPEKAALEVIRNEYKGDYQSVKFDNETTGAEYLSMKTGGISSERPETATARALVGPMKVRVPREQFPVQGEGKVRISKFESRMRDMTSKISDAEAEKLDIPTFKSASHKQQLERASEYVDKNPEDAMKVLRGEKSAPEGLLHNSIMLAMRAKATDDASLATRLASLASTRYGQEISILQKADPTDPTAILAGIVQARRERMSRSLPKADREGRDAEQAVRHAVNRERSSAKEGMRLNQLKIAEAEKILDTLQC